MDWANERYVRLYTRDTGDWLQWPWQSRALFPLLIRKADRAGVIEMGKHGHKGLAAIVNLPAEVVEAGLAGLLEDGSVKINGTVLVMPNFIEAQETRQSDKLRAKESRSRRRSTALAGPSPDVTARHQVSPVGDADERNVTSGSDSGPTGDDPSPDVTARHSVPSRAVPSQAKPTPLPPDGGEDADGPMFTKGATAIRASEVYTDALSEALGKPFARQWTTTDYDALCLALNTLANADSCHQALAWLRSEVLAWARAVPESERRFTGGWKPARFVDWLNNSKPSGPAKPVAKSEPEPPYYRELDPDVVAPLGGVPGTKRKPVVV
jgi:hypothetical protein